MRSQCAASPPLVHVTDVQLRRTTRRTVDPIDINFGGKEELFLELADTADRDVDVSLLRSEFWLYAMRNPSIIGRLGLAAGLTVTVAALSALTLTPALLGLAGRRIDRIKVRRPAAESAEAGTGWQAYADRIGRHPWRYLLGGCALLAVLAVPLFSLRLGHIDAGADPAGFTDRIAYDQISSAFGPGANGPFTLVVDVSHTPADQISALQQDLPGRLAAAPDVASVAPIHASPDGALLTTTLIPATDPQDGATDTLMSTLRSASLPQALRGTGAIGYVTGTTAFQLDFRDQVGARLPSATRR